MIVVVFAGLAVINAVVIALAFGASARRGAGRDNDVLDRFVNAKARAQSLEFDESFEGEAARVAAENRRKKEEYEAQVAEYAKQKAEYDARHRNGESPPPLPPEPPAGPPKPERLPFAPYNPLSVRKSESILGGSDT